MPPTVSPIKGAQNKSLLQLHNYLPQEHGSFWVTVEEMRDRLVHCGVHHSLTVDMVQAALRSSNRGNTLLLKREFNGNSYYVPTKFADESIVPTDQRFTTAKRDRARRININPNKDFFSAIDGASSLLDTVNNTLNQHESVLIRDNEALRKLHNTPEDNLWRGCSIKPYDGNIIMQCCRMDDFISLVSSHSAKCGHEVVLIHRCTNHGAYVKEVWKCHGCHAELELTNCEKVKTEVVERERRHSKHQPDVNLRIAKAFTTGVNMTKTINFVSKILGIKMSNKKNLLHQNKKIRVAVSKVAKHRLTENRREHVRLSRAEDGYSGDIEWEKDGVTHRTSRGRSSMDGASATRSYNHRHKSKQCIEVANSSITNKPIGLIHYQVSHIFCVKVHCFTNKTNTKYIVLQIHCYRCALALNKNINDYEAETGLTVTVDQYSNFSMAHKGFCYRNSTHNPASAEEYQAYDIGRSLLLDEEGNYLGDDTAIFMSEIAADNDTRGPKSGESKDCTHS